jgi:hypothetical protein
MYRRESAGRDRRLWAGKPGRIESRPEKIREAGVGIARTVAAGMLVGTSLNSINLKKTLGGAPCFICLSIRPPASSEAQTRLVQQVTAV